MVKAIIVYEFGGPKVTLSLSLSQTIYQKYIRKRRKVLNLWKKYKQISLLMAKNEEERCCIS